MFTEPVIVSTPDFDSRSYVKVYVDGKRYRLYNGRSLGINCNPNKATNLKDRDKSLLRLKFELLKKLERGWQPGESSVPELRKRTKSVTSKEALDRLEVLVSNEHLSLVYERDLLAILHKLRRFIKEHALERLAVEGINSTHVERFLEGFQSSPTNYMNRRRTLSSLFKRLIEQRIVQVNPVKGTRKIKECAYLNVPYKQEQLRLVLEFVRDHHKQLYLCCLLMYGCFLRPHQEVRHLRRGHFGDDLKKITLSGHENKSRRIRTVLIPNYVQDELVAHGIRSLSDQTNIFTGSLSCYNESYFNTAWTRVKHQMMEQGLVLEQHTLYSFRHTAAQQMYQKTRDPYKIQQAFGHSSLRVTLTYLRNLGLVVDTSLEDLPDL